MGDYVFNKKLGEQKSCELELDIFQESETEFRPIVTATKDHSQGFSNRRSFPSQEEAMEFFEDNEDEMIEESLKDIKA